MIVYLIIESTTFLLDTPPPPPLVPKAQGNDLCYSMRSFACCVLDQCFSFWSTNKRHVCILFHSIRIQVLHLLVYLTSFVDKVLKLPITKNTTAVFVVYLLQIHLPRWFSPTKKPVLLRLQYHDYFYHFHSKSTTAVIVVLYLYHIS